MKVAYWSTMLMTMTCTIRNLLRPLFSENLAIVEPIVVTCVGIVDTTFEPRIRPTSECGPGGQGILLILEAALELVLDWETKDRNVAARSTVWTWELRVLLGLKLIARTEVLKMPTWNMTSWLRVGREPLQAIEQVLLLVATNQVTTPKKLRGSEEL